MGGLELGITKGSLLGGGGFRGGGGGRFRRGGFLVHGSGVLSYASAQRVVAADAAGGVGRIRPGLDRVSGNPWG